MVCNRVKSCQESDNFCTHIGRFILKSFYIKIISTDRDVVLSVVLTPRVVFLHDDDVTTTCHRCVVFASSTSSTSWHVVDVDDVESLSCTTRLRDMLPLYRSVFAFFCAATTCHRRCVVAMSALTTIWHLVGVDNVQTSPCTTRLCDMLPFWHSVFSRFVQWMTWFLHGNTSFCYPFCATTQRFCHAFYIEINVF